ncbi:MAG TPA: type II toxin-antitoxin system PemK/MazF family toxin [Candidatus Nanoarchaeia archaeon]|nr:type II toxin-antitoxin system PemK/MazF family toxin [Candidatus Nanoarchaeia archaeon]
MAQCEQKCVYRFDCDFRGRNNVTGQGAETSKDTNGRYFLVVSYQTFNNRHKTDHQDLLAIPLTDKDKFAKNNFCIQVDSNMLEGTAKMGTENFLLCDHICRISDADLSKKECTVMAHFNSEAFRRIRTTLTRFMDVVTGTTYNP